MDSQTRNVSPDEMRTDATKKLAANPNDNVTWLYYSRDMAAAGRAEAFAKNDLVLANRLDDSATRLFNAAQELESLRERVRLALEMLDRRDAESR